MVTTPSLPLMLLLNIIFASSLAIRSVSGTPLPNLEAASHVAPRSGNNPMHMTEDEFAKYLGPYIQPDLLFSEGVPPVLSLHQPGVLLSGHHLPTSSSSQSDRQGHLSNITPAGERGGHSDSHPTNIVTSGEGIQYRIQVGIEHRFNNGKFASLKAGLCALDYDEERLNVLTSVGNDILAVSMEEKREKIGMVFGGSDVIYLLANSLVFGLRPLDLAREVSGVREVGERKDVMFVYLDDVRNVDVEGHRGTWEKWNKEGDSAKLESLIPSKNIVEMSGLRRRRLYEGVHRDVMSFVVKLSMHVE